MTFSVISPVGNGTQYLYETLESSVVHMLLAVSMTIVDIVANKRRTTSPNLNLP
jgi:hypothetical protein